MVRKMEWAGRATHLGGVPRAATVAAAGAFAKVVTCLLNTTTVHNPETLLRLVRSRPPGRPLLTVSNHMSTDLFNFYGILNEWWFGFALVWIAQSRLDDPLMWGFKGFPTMDARLARWVLAAEDICFKNTVLSYFFRLGKCIPITRGGGIYQDNMNDALDILSDGGWLHTFPEGKVSQGNGPIRRLKWGTASLIARAPITPTVLPIVHCGFEKVMPEKFLFGRRPPLPVCGKKIQIVIGEPIEFDLQKLAQTAKTMGRNSLCQSKGWPTIPSHGLDEAAQRWLYTHISEKIQTMMEKLRNLGATIKNIKA
ncbi:N-acylphosphatidylethanolamine synthase [Acorus gramineus]|uniref:Tafazzin family protein n=1 Tax=Acorus gramineus TaxID=55184 RepID=A0AAV9AGN3_ACOGR|nr:N-acylphosphatidylethanolamine synthase [Acorus gramineus]